MLNNVVNLENMKGGIKEGVDNIYFLFLVLFFRVVMLRSSFDNVKTLCIRIIILFLI